MTKWDCGCHGDGQNLIQLHDISIFDFVCRADFARNGLGSRSPSAARRKRNPNARFFPVGKWLIPGRRAHRPDRVTVVATVAETAEVVRVEVQVVRDARVVRVERRTQVVAATACVAERRTVAVARCRQED